MKKNLSTKLSSLAAKASTFYALAEAKANHMVLCATSDAFADAEKAVKSLQTQLTSIAEVLFPLAIVICAVSMFFTRDQKKFDVEKHILIGCCLAYALVILVDKGHLATTIQNLF